MILPSGIVTSDTTKFFFQDLVENGQVVAILDFENRRRLFPAVQRNVRFCLFTISKSSIQEILFAAQLTSTEQLRQPGATYRLSSEDIRRINPNTLTCPMFSSKADAEVIKKIYRNVPCLLDETTEDGDPWGVSFQTLFHMANDSEMFRTFEQLSNDGWMLDGYCFIGKNPKYLPLYESKFTHQYNHRAATFEGISSEDLFGTHPATNEVTSEQLRNPEYSIKPRYWVSEAELQGGIEETGWLMGFRDAISATADARSLIATVLPPVPVGHTESLVHVEPRGPEAACLLAMMNSFPMDYVLKQKATGGHASYYIMKQLPTPPPEAFAQACPWFSELTMAEWVSLRVLELSYTSYNIAKFAESLSYSGAPFVWDEERRFLLRRELDAAAFHIFGLDKPEVEHILNNFSIVKSRDLEESSEYRTKRITVEIFDEISRAIQTGESYKTRLNPPPADPRVAHEVEPLRR